MLHQALDAAQRRGARERAPADPPPPAPPRDRPARGSRACRRSRRTSGAWPRRGRDRCRGRDRAPAPPLGWPRQCSATAWALRLAWTDAQHEGAQAAQQEPGPRSRREWRRWPSAGGRPRCQKASSRAAMRAPASMSLWPLRYLVAECMTMSAPCSIGRVSTGVAEVLSTPSTAPARWAISADRGDVGDLPARVGRRLDPHHLRLPGPHGRGDRAQVGHVQRARPRRPRAASSSISHVRSAQYISLGATMVAELGPGTRS